MMADIERTRHFAEQILSARAEAFVPEAVISRLRYHLCFQNAVAVALDGASELYGGKRLLNRVMNNRDRLIGGIIALYLHFCPASKADEPGFTARRFQAFCVDQKLYSFGRARALLTLMCSPIILSQYQAYETAAIPAHANEGSDRVTAAKVTVLV